MRRSDSILPALESLLVVRLLTVVILSSRDTITNSSVVCSAAALVVILSSHDTITAVSEIIVVKIAAAVHYRRTLCLVALCLVLVCVSGQIA